MFSFEMKHLVIPIVLLFSFCLYSCNRAKEEEKKIEEVEEIEFEKSEPIVSISVKVPDYQFQFEDLKLNQHIKDMDLRAFKHYGEFYTEDFSIFRLDRIDFLAESHEIEDIELFFIDSVLVKVHAFLRKDFSTLFIKKYGKAKIAIHDYHNKKILEKENLIVKVNGRSRLNSSLDNYTLKWKREESDIFYNVDRNNDYSRANKIAVINNGFDERDKIRYKLTTQTKDFRDQMSWVKWESYKVARGLN